MAALAFAAYLPALRAEFVDFDVDPMSVENANYRGFDRVRLAWMFTTTRLKTPRIPTRA